MGLGKFFNSGLHKSEGCKEWDCDFHTGCCKLRGSLLNIWMASIDPRMVPKLDFLKNIIFKIKSYLKNSRWPQRQTLHSSLKILIN